MSSLEGFRTEVREQFLRAEQVPGEVEKLGEALGLASVETPEALISAALANNKDPNLLHRCVQHWPDVPEFEVLLRQWEDDANLQDSWAEMASARDLQDAKAYYVLADRHGADEQRTARLLRKISRALADHRDNTNGEYEIYGAVRANALLGNGEIATVYKGTHLVSGETVAVKVLKRDAAGNATLVDLLQRTTEELQSVLHPQIATVLEPVRPDDRPRARPFYVMEYSPGGTLEHQIGSASFDLPDRQRAAVRLCQGLAYAHRKGILHGDLKPANVLLAEGRVRLSDFVAGRGQVADSALADAIKKVARPYYLAPEVAGGKRPSVRSDIFSLGRLLFRLFTKKDENLYDVMVPQLFKEQLEQHLQSHPELIGVILRSSALEPNERPGSVAELLAELHRTGGQLGIDSDPEVAQHRATGNWEALIEAQRTALLSQPPAGQIAALEDIAAIQEYVQEDARAALETWAQAFRTDPAHGDGALEAELDRLVADLGTPDAARVEAEAVVAVLDWGKVEARDEVLRLKLKAAQLFQQDVGDNRASIPLYLDALGLMPTDEVAYSSLDVLYQEEQDWPGLAALLERRLATRENDTDRVALLLRIARIQEERIGDASAAAATFVRVRGIDPRHADAFAHLDRLYQRLGRWEELAGLLADEIAAKPDSQRLIALQFELGQVLQKHLGQAAAAVGLYRQILQSEPDHPQAISALEGLMAEDVEAHAAAELLEPIYRRREQRSQLAGALEVLLRAMRSEEQRWVATLKEIAGIRERDEHSVDAAFDVFARLHRGRPDLTWVWEELERLAPHGSQHPRWSEVVDLYRMTIDLEEEREAADPAFRVALWLRIGEMLVAHLDNAEQAIEAYRAVLEIDPRHGEALARLELLYERTAHWNDLIDVLDVQKQIQFDAGNGDAAVRVMHRIAALWEERLDNPQQAIQTYAAALSVSGRDDHAVEQLERLSRASDHVAAVADILDPHYTGLSDWDRLLALLERLLELNEEMFPAERADVLVRMAQISESSRGDAKGAFGFLMRAAESDVERDDVHGELERVAGHTDAWAELVQFYDRLLGADRVQAAARQQAMRFKMAEWYRDRLESPEAAERSFRAVLALNPDHVGALDALDDLHTQRGEFPELYEVLARKADLADESQQRKEILFRLAHLSADRLGDLGRAIEAYQRIVALGEPDPAALDGLAGIYERQQDYPKLLLTLQRRADVERDAPTKIHLLTRIGELAYNRLDDASTALASYEEALALRPEAPRDILQALAQLYLAHNDLEAWFVLLPPRLEHAQSSEERVGLRLEAAALAARPEAPDGANATEHYEAVLALEPYRPEVLSALEREYAQHQRWQELQDIYRRQFVGIHLKAADLAAAHLGDPDRAVEHLKQASLLDPDRIEILDRRIDIHQARSDWDQVVQLVERKLALLPDSQAQGRLLVQLAEALERSGESGRALEAIQRALAVDPDDLQPLLGLSRLAVATDRFEEFVPPVLERLRGKKRDAESERLLEAITLQSAAVTAMHAGNSEAAVKALTDVLKLKGLPAESGIELMRPVFQRFGAERAMVDALTGSLKKPGKSSATTKAMDLGRRGAIYRAAAQLSEALGDGDDAYNLYARFFAEQPGDRAVRQEMLRLAETVGRRGEAIDAIEARLREGLEQPELAIELALMLGEIFETQAQPDRAITHYKLVLELRQDHPAALAAMDRLYEQGGRWSELRPVLERRIGTAEQESQRLTLEIRLARLIDEHFDEPATVADVCIRVVRDAPEEHRQTRKVARAMLEGLCEKHSSTGDPLFFRIAAVLEREYARGRQREPLLDILKKQIALLPDDAPVERRHDLLTGLARTAHEYNDPELALRHALEATRLVPQRLELYPLLEELAARLDMWGPLVELYSELGRREDLEPDLRRELMLKAAAWLDERMARPGDAADAYAAVLSLDPASREAIAALERIYVELGQQENLLDLLMRRADLETDAESRQRVLQQAAKLAHEELGLTDRAIACYQRLLDEFGRDGQVLERLRGLYGDGGFLEPLYQVLKAQLEEAQEQRPEAIPALQLELGRLAWRQLDDVGRAVPHLNEAIYAESTHDEALSELAQLYESAGRVADLAELLQRQLPMTADPNQRLGLALRGAALADESLPDKSAAIALYEEALEVDADNAEARGALYRLLTAAERWPDLLSHLEDELSRRAGDPAGQVGLALRIAEMAMNPRQLGDAALAQHYLELSLRTDPANSQAASLLVQLNLDAGRVDAAVEVLGHVLASTRDVAGRVQLLLRRGDIYLDELGQEQEASADYDAAFRLNENNPEAVDRLARLLTRRQAWAELLSMYERLSQRVSRVEDKVDVALKVSALVEQYNLPRERLIHVLEDTLRADPPYPLNIQLILRLIAAYRDTGNLTSAAAYVEMGLAEPNGASNRAFQAELWYFKGLIASSGNRHDEALAAHEACYKLDNGHVPNLIAYSRLLYAAQDWDEAVRILQVALLKQAELTVEQKVDVYYMMGMAWINKGDRRRARDMFNRVLGIDRGHQPTIDALANL